MVIIPQPSFDYVQSKTNLYLLFATIFSTTWAGALWWASYSDSPVLDLNYVWLRVLITPDVLFMGFLTYSLPLMAILGAHEMGLIRKLRNRLFQNLEFCIHDATLGADLARCGCRMDMVDGALERVDVACFNRNIEIVS